MRTAERWTRVVIAVTVWVIMIGCQPNGGRGRDVVERVDLLSWRGRLRDGASVEVTGVVFPKSVTTDKVFREALQFNQSRIARLKKERDRVQEAEIKRRMDDEIAQFDSGFYNGVGSWEGWPLVMTFPVLLEGKGRVTKVVVICRWSRRPLEFALMIKVNGDIPPERVVDVARTVTRTLDCTDGYAAATIPVEEGPLFRPDGGIRSPTVAAFAADGGFVRQH